MKNIFYISILIISISCINIYAQESSNQTEEIEELLNQSEYVQDYLHGWTRDLSIYLTPPNIDNNLVDVIESISEGNVWLFQLVDNIIGTNISNSIGLRITALYFENGQLLEIKEKTREIKYYRDNFPYVAIKCMFASNNNNYFASIKSSFPSLSNTTTSYISILDIADDISNMLSKHRPPDGIYINEPILLRVYGFGEVTHNIIDIESIPIPSKSLVVDVMNERECVIALIADLFYLE